MKVGDLIIVKRCGEANGDQWQIIPCECFFCYNKSSRIGLVVEVVVDVSQGSEPPGWWVQFDCGEWEIFPSDLDLNYGDTEVISESR